jgi:hypothetical protein
VYAEALRQVVAARSAAGSLTRLDDIAAVTGTAWQSEQPEVDVWALAGNSTDWFLLDAPAQQGSL